MLNQVAKVVRHEPEIDRHEDGAKLRDLPVLDATCPLVAKVHKEGQRYSKSNYEVILIGHEGHPEVVGTMGRIPGTGHLVSSAEAVAKLEVKNPKKLAYVTQTTLSVDDANRIIDPERDMFSGQELIIPSRDALTAFLTRKPEAVGS